MRLLVILLLLTEGAFALSPDRYHDKVWQSEYAAPQRPLSALSISHCAERLNATECAVLNSSDPNTDAVGTAFARIISGDSGSAYSMRDFVHQWNGNIAIGGFAPDRVQVYGGNLIRNAWIAVADIDSITDERNRTWVTAGARPRVEKNLTFVVAERKRATGECSDPYLNSFGYDYTVDTLFNNAPGDAIPHLSHGQQINITAKLTFVAEYTYYVFLERHIRECDEYGECAEHIFCDREIVTMTETGSVSDSMNVYCYDDSSFAVRNIIERMSTGPDGNTSVSGTMAASFPGSVNAKFYIGNSSIAVTTTRYTVEESEKAYGMMRVVSYSDGMHKAESGISSTGIESQNGVPQTKHPLPEEFQGSANSTDGTFLLYRYIAMPGKLDCSVEFESYFSNWIADFGDCAYDPLNAVNISLAINSSGKNGGAKIHLQDGRGAAIANRTIDISYLGGLQSVNTDSEGTTLIRINLTDSRTPLAVGFETDLIHPSANEVFVIEPYSQPIDRVFDFAKVCSVCGIVLYAYKRVGGLMML